MEKELINKEVLRKIIDNSPLCQHAIKELELAGYKSDEEGPCGWMYNQVMEAVAVFSSHGHSGFSAPFEIDLVKKLCSWEVLSPLTFKDDEWMQTSSDGTKQNKRCSNIFKNSDGSITDVRAFVKKPLCTYRYGTKRWEKNESSTCWHGGLFEYESSNFTGRYFNSCIIRYDDKGYTPKKTITIPCYEIEVAPDNYIMLVSTFCNELAELRSSYVINWKECSCLKDVSYKEITPELVEKAYNELRT